MKCSTCAQDKSEEKFCYRVKATGVRNTKCKGCVNQYNKQHYRRNQKSYIAKARRWEKKFGAERRKLVDELKAKPCMDCNRTYPPYVMDFDHLPGTIKRYNISNITKKMGSQRLFLEELAKCELVCANCHRIRTFTRRAQ